MSESEYRSREPREHRRRRRSRSPASQAEERHSRGSTDRRDGHYRKRQRSRDRDRHSVSHRRRRDSRSRDRHERRSRDESRSRREPLRIEGALPSQEDSFAISKGEEPEKPKEKPNYGITGVLAAASNSVAQADGTSVTLKYHEPAEARKPSPRDQWKLYMFKGQDVLDTIDLSARSCWLVGREMTVVDLPAEHPSISKQHAVIQFRYTEKRNEFGDRLGRVKPYLIDLESANGTILNGDRIPDSRYLELRDKDMVQFGDSTREYIVMLAPRD